MWRRSPSARLPRCSAPHPDSVAARLSCTASPRGGGSRPARRPFMHIGNTIQGSFEVGLALTGREADLAGAQRGHQDKLLHARGVGCLHSRDRAGAGASEARQASGEGSRGAAAASSSWEPRQGCWRTCRQAGTPPHWARVGGGAFLKELALGQVDGQGPGASGCAPRPGEWRRRRRCAWGRSHRPAGPRERPQRTPPAQHSAAQHSVVNAT